MTQGPDRIQCSARTGRFGVAGEPKIAAALLWVAIAAAPAAEAQFDAAAFREGVVQVAVLDDQEVRRLGSGVVVDDAGHVLTAAHLVRDEDQVVVVPVTTKAQMVARIVRIDERADLALLQVSGLQIPSLPFALDGFEDGRNVLSAGFWEGPGGGVFLPTVEGDPVLDTDEGTVSGWERREGATEDLPLTLLRHNAMIRAAGYGGPVINECNQVAGLNRGDPERSPRALRGGVGPGDVVHAVHLDVILDFLAAEGVAFRRSDSVCPVALARTTQERDSAVAEIENLRQQLDESRQRNRELQTAIERLQAEAETLRNNIAQIDGLLQQAEAEVQDRATEAQEIRTRLQAARQRGAVGEAEAERLQDELDAKEQEEQIAVQRANLLEAERNTTQKALDDNLAEQDEEDRTLQVVIYSVASAGALVALIIFLGFRKRSRQLAAARENAADAQREAADAGLRARPPVVPDCTLIGETGDGEMISLSIRGSQLAGDGAVIGRSPQTANFVINDGTVSRRHARLLAKGDSLFLEDLHATNGTMVNGSVVDSGRNTAVHDGDTIELGAVRIRVHFAGGGRRSPVGGEPGLQSAPGSGVHAGGAEHSGPESGGFGMAGESFAGPAAGIRRGEPFHGDEGPEDSGGSVSDA